jgi:hypothetical protein
MSFSISFQHPFNRAGGRTSNVRLSKRKSPPYRTTMLFPRIALILAVFVLASGCSTSSLRTATIPVKHGMTPQQLVSAYGEPLRKVRHSDSSEDWFYKFGSQIQESHPFSESTSTDHSATYSTGHTRSTTTTMTERPIHLSPRGTVVGEIPSGSVILE